MRKVSSDLRIGIVTARFNSEVTSKLKSGALQALEESGMTSSQIVQVDVAGAFEIPLACKALIEYARVDGVVALGAVIRGETAHFDYVCQAVERGCSELMLRFGRPIGFGVLTTENDEQALERAGGSFGNKGAEAAQTVLEMCELLHGLKNIRHPQQSQS
ncbi:MAG: 6,7-dimethyl-8-ribityllumazine synthase [Oligoflexia bacterium]|nr:6,7-dimethyl-8-ribityllumazine synthase [Oligoflexia bacterium]